MRRRPTIRWSPPCLEWMRGYSRGEARRDGVAGVLLAAYLVPVSLAYASLAGVPPQVGLYSSMLAGLAFAVFTSGRHTAIAVTSAISLMLGTALAEMSGGDPQRHVWLASLTALYVGVIAVVAWAMRAGIVIAFISETVLAGFKVGVAVHIAASQLPKLLGIKTSGEGFFEKAASLVRHLGDVHLPSLLVGASGIALMALGERVLRNRPVALVVIVLSILVMTFTGLEATGVRVLGTIPEGLPHFSPPPIRGRDVDGLLGLALACFLLAAVETMAVSRTFALKHGYRVDADKEFLAIGGANLLVGLAQGYPVSGGMSQSAVNEKGGASTPASLVAACLLVGAITAFFGGVFRNLPDPILAAVVLMAIRGLVDVAAFRRLLRFSRTEFALAVVALLAVLGFGVLKGVLIAAAVSILLLLRRAAHPLIAILGRRADTGGIVRLDRSAGAKRVPDTLLARIYGGLLYFNVDSVQERLLGTWREEGSPKLVLLDLGAVPMVDLAGAKCLGELRAELAKHGAEFRLAEARSTVRHALRAAEVDRPPWPGEPGGTIEAALALDRVDPDRS